MPYLLQTSCVSHSEPQGAVKQSNIQRDFSKSQTQYAVCIVQSHILNMPLAGLQGSGCTAFLLFVFQFLPPVTAVCTLGICKRGRGRGIRLSNFK